MIYLDYAATSGQKPETVYSAADDALRNASGNPGRSGHKISLKAGDIVAEARLLCSRFFHSENPESMIFCSNATDALNLAIQGSVSKGDHIITSSIEHNAVARPLEHLKDAGVEVTKVNASLETGVDPSDVASAIKENTKLAVFTHMSNVTGTINDVAAIGAICREKGVPFLVDASQSTGAIKIDVQKMNIDMLAFPGHKCLYGPQGTGGLYIKPGLDIRPIKQGGTGSRSEMLRQPEERPDRYESGTLNVPGIAGLGAGIKFIMDTGIDKIHARDKALTDRLIDGLSSLEGVRIYSPLDHERGPVVSITIDGYEPQDISIYLDQVFDIATRSGLHCAPDAHGTIGTLDSGGTVRISPGYFTTEDDIDACIEAVGIISRGEL